MIARLEYRLTKAYFRYTMGQNFGFMNPSFVFNRLDTLAPNPYDSSKRPVRFRGLFDVKMAHADDAFYQKAMQMVRCDSVASFLKEVQPKNPFYYQLLEKLKAGGLGKAMRIKFSATWNVAAGDSMIIPGNTKNMWLSIYHRSI